MEHHSYIQVAQNRDNEAIKCISFLISSTLYTFIEHKTEAEYKTG